MTPKQVREVLKKVMDPELGINVVDLGLIYDIVVSEQRTPARRRGGVNRVKIKMTLTTPGCPLGGWFVEQVKQAVATGLKIDENQVMVEITFDPPWSQELMTDEAKVELGF
jgi:metal-sulfur cluster biosynthetic enzyme